MQNRRAVAPRLTAYDHAKEIGHHTKEMLLSDNEISKTVLAFTKWSVRLTKAAVDATARKLEV